MSRDTISFYATVSSAIFSPLQWAFGYFSYIPIELSVFLSIALCLWAMLYNLISLAGSRNSAEASAPFGLNKYASRIYILAFIFVALLYWPPRIVAALAPVPQAPSAGSAGLPGPKGDPGTKGDVGPQGPPGAAAQFPPEAQAEIDSLRKRVGSLSELVKLDACAQSLPIVSGSVSERTIRDAAIVTALPGSPPSRGLGPPDVTTILASAFKQAETCLGAQRVPKPQPVPDDAADVRVSDEPNEPDAARRYRRVVARQKQAEAWLTAVRQTISERRQEVMSSFLQ